MLMSGLTKNLLSPIFSEFSPSSSTFYVGLTPIIACFSTFVSFTLAFKSIADDSEKIQEAIDKGKPPLLSKAYFKYGLMAAVFHLMLSGVTFPFAYSFSVASLSCFGGTFCSVLLLSCAFDLVTRNYPETASLVYSVYPPVDLEKNEVFSSKNEINKTQYRDNVTYSNNPSKAKIS